MVDQSHFFHAFRGGELSLELIVEVEIVLRDLTILKMFHNFQIAEEVGALAIDNRSPLLIELGLVIVGQTDGSDGRVDITTCVTHNDAQRFSRPSAHFLSTLGKPLT